MASALSIGRAISLTFIPLLLAAIPMQVKSQSLPTSENSTQTESTVAPVDAELAYVQPTPRETLKRYTFDAFGPYAIGGSALVAGVDQLTNTPPEWNQGLHGYSYRFASDFGIALVGTTARYGLASTLKQDTAYYRCQCSGIFPRMRHAVVWTFTARRGETGRRVFSFPALLAPYAGMTTAVYGWYPDRYGVKDAFRMGNYSLLESVAGSLALEFLYRGPHALSSHIHLKNRHAMADTSPRP